MHGDSICRLNIPKLRTPVNCSDPPFPEPNTDGTHAQYVSIKYTVQLVLEIAFGRICARRYLCLKSIL